MKKTVIFCIMALCSALLAMADSKEIRVSYESRGTVQTYTFKADEVDSITYSCRDHEGRMYDNPVVQRIWSHGTSTDFTISHIRNVEHICVVDEQPETPDTPVTDESAAVDLGLSVRWASCNLGAGSPEERGHFYAWGETRTKTVFSEDNYKWYDGTAYTKYNQDDKQNIELQDDAAHVTLGGDWRMPTAKELQELMNSCKWTWTTQKGVSGYVVEGPNGKSIFLPATGFMMEDFLVEEQGGFYQSSTLNKNGKDYTGMILYNGIKTTGVMYKECGYPIRPVCK